MSDPFNLPTSPNGATTGGTANPATPPEITVSDIKDFISPKLYGELSWDENRSADEVTNDCIGRAETFAKTLLHLVGEELNLYSETQRSVVKTLTVYELYLYNGDRYKAQSYLDRAEKLISNRYRSLDKLRENGDAYCSVAKAKV